MDGVCIERSIFLVIVNERSASIIRRLQFWRFLFYLSRQERIAEFICWNATAFLLRLLECSLLMHEVKRESMTAQEYPAIPSNAMSGIVIADLGIRGRETHFPRHEDWESESKSAISIPTGSACKHSRTHISYFRSVSDSNHWKSHVGRYRPISRS